MQLFDVAVTLDRQNSICAFDWFDRALEKSLSHAWAPFVGRPISALFRSQLIEGRFGALTWGDDSFLFGHFQATTDESTLFLKRDSQRQFLYEGALEKITDGIQVYDKNACLVYINETSRRISGIPDDIEVRGRHLADLYDVEDSVSTILTCLKTAAPVFNRFDIFETTKGAQITSTNTAYPIFKQRALVGAIVFEQDLSVIKSQIDRLESIRTTMLEKTAAMHPAKFSGYTFDNVIGDDPKLTGAVRLAKKVAPQDISVLLVGETGTGKEIFAQSIHKASPRKDKKFVAVNCAAVPDTLIEGMFFGTQKGSFTGSVDAAGLLEEANGGTLFLDELNSMSLSMQSKLLRVIQEGTFRRVGGSRDIKTDIRFVSSCNEQPARLLNENVLRKDLFYRLSAVRIDLPPLREHPDDLEALVARYISVKAYQFIKPVQAVSPKVNALFRRYNWPGNVRELYHVLDFALNVVEDGVIEAAHLPRYLLDQLEGTAAAAQPSASGDWTECDLQQTMDDYENQVLRSVLAHHGGNISRAATALGLRRQSLQYRLKKYGIIV